MQLFSWTPGPPPHSPLLWRPWCCSPHCSSPVSLDLALSLLLKYLPFPSGGPPPFGEIVNFQLHLRNQFTLLTDLAVARNESCIHNPSSAFISSSTETSVLECRLWDPREETCLLPCWSGGSCLCALACTGMSWFIHSFTEFAFEWSHSQNVARKSKSTNWMVTSFMCLRYQKPASHRVYPGLPAFCGSLFSPDSAVIPALLGSLLAGLSLQAGGLPTRAASSSLGCGLCTSRLLYPNTEQTVAIHETHKQKCLKFYIIYLYVPFNLNSLVQLCDW